MKIIFRHVPFNDQQRQTLTAMVEAAGREALWCPHDELPSPVDLQDCEVLMGYYPPELFRSAPALKWVQTPAAGVDRICGDIYPSDEVVLTNCSGAFGVSIAEYMISGLLMLMRHMPAYSKNQRAHVWESAGVCRSIQGSNITVIGMGDVGTKFAQRAKALGARVRGVRRAAGPLPEGFDEEYTSDRICEAVRGADAVVMCLPGTKSAQKLVSAECIAQMRPDAILVNCGRGTTLDEEALIDALRTGRLGGAVLDVFAVEPLPADSSLWDMDNVVLTPHIAGNDNDPINSCMIYDIFRENLSRYLSGQPLTHVVDRTRGY